MIVIIVFYLSCSHLGASMGQITVKNMTELEGNYVTNKSKALNSSGMLEPREIDKQNNVTYDLVYNLTRASDNVTSEKIENLNNSKAYLTFTPHRQELPLGMIIAGPAAAVGIMIFLCATYYWHTVQLDRQAKRLSFTLFVTPDENTKNDNTKGTVTLTKTQKLVPSRSKTFLNSEFNGIYNQRRKSTLSVPTLMPPGAAMGKRGSSWSALADQEIVNLSAPRRHSTFIV